VRRLYQTDPADPRHYHLVIDSTALALDAVTELIVRALAHSPGQGPLGADRYSAAAGQ
jgi:cytidylate kinase